MPVSAGPGAGIDLPIARHDREQVIQLQARCGELLRCCWLTIANRETAVSLPLANLCQVIHADGVLPGLERDVSLVPQTRVNAGVGATGLAPATFEFLTLDALRLELRTLGAGSTLAGSAAPG